jgi:hypothetical protein
VPKGVPEGVVLVVAIAPKSGFVADGVFEPLLYGSV